jgi:hypothetical protein
MKRIPFLYQGVSLLIFIPFLLYFWTGQEWSMLFLYPVMAGGTFVLAWSVRRGYRLLDFYEDKERFSVGIFCFGMWVASLFAVGPLVGFGLAWVLVILVAINICLTNYAGMFPWQWKRTFSDRGPLP